MSDARFGFSVTHTDGARAARCHDDGARRRPDAGVHAGRHAGRREGRDAPRPRGVGRRDPAEQHLPSLSASRATRSIARRGGLHRFIGWTKPILTDSGGYQVFSLAGSPDDRRRGRALPVASRRVVAPADAGERARTSRRSSVRTSRWCSTSASRIPSTMAAARAVDGAHRALGRARARPAAGAARRARSTASSSPIPGRRSSASCRAASFPTCGEESASGPSPSASRPTRSAA